MLQEFGDLVLRMCKRIENVELHLQSEPIDLIDC